MNNSEVLSAPPPPVGCRISSEMRHEKNPKDSSNQGWQKGGDQNSKNRISPIRKNRNMGLLPAPVHGETRPSRNRDHRSPGRYRGISPAGTVTGLSNPLPLWGLLIPHPVHILPRVSGLSHPCSCLFPGGSSLPGYPRRIVGNPTHGGRMCRSH